MTGFNSKRDAAADKLQEHDPCPGCIRGGVCRTPKCGRLALPLDHPFRNLQPAQSEKEKISRQMTAEIAAARALAQPAQKCWCTTCRPITMDDMRFVVCPDCGNKRCPKANDHRNACTNSNEVGQKGSSWEHVKPLAQPAQEPVAWTTMPESEDWCFVSGNKDPNGKLDGKWFPLYTAPPQRKPLTDEAVLDIADYCLYNGGKTYGVLEFARAIEAAHGIKENT